MWIYPLPRWTPSCVAFSESWGVQKQSVCSSAVADTMSLMRRRCKCLAGIFCTSSTRQGVASGLHSYRRGCICILSTSSTILCDIICNMILVPLSPCHQSPHKLDRDTKGSDWKLGNRCSTRSSDSSASHHSHCHYHAETVGDDNQ